MPAKMKMFISNNNGVPNMNYSLPQTPQTKPLTTNSGSLNSSMITRIHTARAGCGSCGR